MYACTGSPKIFPLESWTVFSTSGLILLPTGDALTTSVMSASCLRSIRPCTSVYGIATTVGSVPAARSAWNVCTSYPYSEPSILIFGFAFSNSATRSVQVFSAAAWSGVGFCPTLIVTVPSASYPRHRIPTSRRWRRGSPSAATTPVIRRVVSTCIS